MSSHCANCKTWYDVPKLTYVCINCRRIIHPDASACTKCRSYNTVSEEKQFVCPYCLVAEAVPT